MGFLQYMFVTLLALSQVSAIFRGSHSHCGEHPYAVQIMHTAASGGESYLCGGTLITPRHVLTATHCALRDFKVPGTKCNPADLKVNLLKCDNSKLSRMGGSVYDVIEAHIQDRYVQQGTVDADIAVLTLSEEVKYHPFLSAPAAVPAYDGPVQSKWEEDKNNRILLIGAGTIDTDQTGISDWLRQIRAEILNKQECSMRADAALGTPFSFLQLKQDHFFCALDPITLGGACGGDSGSGSHEYIGDRKRVIGVVSAGPIVCSQPNHVNAYTSLTAYLTWIKGVIGSSYQLKQI